MYGVHQDYGIKGKSIIITGAASGIGRSATLLLADYGANITAADINEAGLRETVTMAKNLAGKVQTIRADITSESDIKALVAAAIDGFGQLNGAANIAGVGSPQKSMMELSWDHVRRMSDVNMVGVWFCLKHEIAAMLESGGGSIVNVSSMAALQGFPNSSEYAAPKAGIIAMGRALLHDFGRQGVRINTICPGPIDTPMFRSSLGGVPGAEEQVKASTLTGRAAHPDEPGYVIRFLLSKESSFITGATIVVDGGLSA
jgi:NAD(P)-dependent dehydrogenase (short-subunit alcohol dehydrogenase family)